MMQYQHMTDTELLQEAGRLSEADNPLAFHLAARMDQLATAAEYDEITDQLETAADEIEELKETIADLQQQLDDERSPFEKYEYIIGSHFLPSIFNGDDTGLEQEEIDDLAAFCSRAETGDGHWSGGDEDDHLEFAECDVTGLRGDCYRVIWNRRKE